jgi:hypothetical protein
MKILLHIRYTCFKEHEDAVNPEQNNPPLISTETLAWHFCCFNASLLWVKEFGFRFLPQTNIFGQEIICVNYLILELFIT